MKIEIDTANRTMTIDGEKVELGIFSCRPEHRICVDGVYGIEHYMEFSFFSKSTTYPPKEHKG